MNYFKMIFALVAMVLSVGCEAMFPESTFRSEQADDISSGDSAGDMSGSDVANRRGGNSTDAGNTVDAGSANTRTSEDVQGSVDTGAIDAGSSSTQADCAKYDGILNSSGECVSICKFCANGTECKDTNGNGYGDTCVSITSVSQDAGSTDTGSADAGSTQGSDVAIDAGSTDTQPSQDAGPADAGPADVGSVDSGIVDTGLTQDVGSTDVFAADSGSGDAQASQDAGVDSSDSGNQADTQADICTSSAPAICNTQMKGVCSVGVQTCLCGICTCTQSVKASLEVCDSLDNNCDGVVDEGCPVALVPVSVALTFPDAMLRVLSMQIWWSKPQLGTVWDADKTVSSTGKVLSEILGSINAAACGIRINIAEGDPAFKWFCQGGVIESPVTVEIKWGAKTYTWVDLKVWLDPKGTGGSCSVTVQTNPSPECIP